MCSYCEVVSATSQRHWGCISIAVEEPVSSDTGVSSSRVRTRRFVKKTSCVGHCVCYGYPLKYYLGVYSHIYIEYSPYEKRQSLFSPWGEGVLIYTGGRRGGLLLGHSTPYVIMECCLLTVCSISSYGVSGFAGLVLLLQFPRRYTLAPASVLGCRSSSDSFQNLRGTRMLMFSSWCYEIPQYGYGDLRILHHIWWFSMSRAAFWGLGGTGHRQIWRGVYH